MASGKFGVGRGDLGSVQYAQCKYSTQGGFLAQANIKTPNHYERDAQDHEVDEEIGNFVLPVELSPVGTRPAWCALISVIRDRIALKDGREDARQEVAGDDTLRQN